MKRSDHLLARLFQLVRQAPPSDIPAPPFGFETAVIAHWKASLGKISIPSPLVALRRVALCACIFAFAFGFWNRDQLTQIFLRYDSATRIVDSAMITGLEDE